MWSWWATLAGVPFAALSSGGGNEAARSDQRRLERGVTDDLGPEGGVGPLLQAS